MSSAVSAQEPARNAVCGRSLNFKELAIRSQTCASFSQSFRGSIFISDPRALFWQAGGCRTHASGTSSPAIMTTDHGRWSGHVKTTSANRSQHQLRQIWLWPSTIITANVVTDRSAARSGSVYILDAFVVDPQQTVKITGQGRSKA